MKGPVICHFHILGSQVIVTEGVKDHTLQSFELLVLF